MSKRLPCVPHCIETVTKESQKEQREWYREKTVLKKSVVIYMRQKNTQQMIATMVQGKLSF